jgi:hypothetical protein
VGGIIVLIIVVWKGVDLRFGDNKDGDGEYYEIQGERPNIDPRNMVG